MQFVSDRCNDSLVLHQLVLDKTVRHIRKLAAYERFRSSHKSVSYCATSSSCPDSTQPAEMNQKTCS